MNLFAGEQISIPNELREYFGKLCQTTVDGVTNRIQDSPFPRNVDFWFTGLGYAIKKDLPPTEIDKKNTYNAIPGTVFGSDNFRSDMMVLFCISKTGNLDIINNPADMLRLCNTYAVSGVKALINELESQRGDNPLDFLCDRFEEITQNS